MVNIKMFESYDSNEERWSFISDFSTVQRRHFTELRAGFLGHCRGEC